MVAKVGRLRAIAILAAGLWLLFSASPVRAHPHVWVTVKSDLVYAPDGSITGVRHAWTFDDMFSVFAIQGLKQKKKGEFTREELAPLAKVNVESLKEYDFFTYARANGHKVEFNDPTAGSYLVFDPKQTVLTLHFVLPLKKPIRTKDLTMEIFDRDFFVDFELAENDPVKLIGAPAQCKLTIGKPKEMGAALAQQLSQIGADQRSHGDCYRGRVRQQDHGEMPVKTVVGGRLARHLAIIAVGVAAALIILGVADFALAQAEPFGVPRSQVPAAQLSGVTGWIFAKQAEFYKQFSGLIRAAKSDGSAAWSLFGLSFLYGVFHAAGPGHGKAVIASYLLADDRTWRHGVALSSASALCQALVAIAIVCVGSMILEVTAKQTSTAMRLVETGGYLIIVAIGARLVWIKGSVVLQDVLAALPPALIGAVSVSGGSRMKLLFRDAPPQRRNPACTCGHAHIRTLDTAGGAPWWRAGFWPILGIGLRPCSGAIIVLVFAASQDIFIWGITSTLAMAVGTALSVTAVATLAVKAKSLAIRLIARRQGAALWALRVGEAVAGALVLAFGLLLLIGYLASEAFPAI